MRRSVTPVPLFFERADGPYFYDVDGHRLVDYTLAWGPLIIGSNHGPLNAAVSRQLTKAYAFGSQHRLEYQLAETIVESVPGIEQVIFSNTGTEAVQAAIRIARAKTGRDKIVKFEGHYHGWMNNVLVSYKPQGGNPFTPAPSCGGQPKSEYADTLVLPWNNFEALRKLFAQCGETIACVICEPILANSGCCLPDPGYLEELIGLCRSYGAVSIFDEVITGFRIALGGAREHFELEPDLSVYGKALAGGFTLSAVGGRAEMFDVLRDGRTIHAGTYNGNPVNLIAGIETIRALREPGMYEKMHAHGTLIQEAIKKAATRRGYTLSISGVGTVFSVHFGVDRPPRDYREFQKSDMALYHRFRAAMLRHQVHLLPDARWYIGASHDEAAITMTLDAIERSIQEISE
jgi:glutamate-1-semialdehyde 2,1-aminomutase